MSLFMSYKKKIISNVNTRYMIYYFKNKKRQGISLESQRFFNKCPKIYIFYFREKRRIKEDKK